MMSRPTARRVLVLLVLSAALGGEAWVEDRPGGGARFVVRLPTEAA